MNQNSFFRQVLAVIVGICCIFSFFALMSLAMLTVVGIAGSMATTVRDGSVLRISLDGGIAERVNDNPLAELLGGTVLEEQGLDDMLAAVRVAAEDDRIYGIFLDGGTLSASPAMLQELRHALADFKKSGKFVLAYADNYSQAGYYVASVADSVLINPSGMIEWHGMAANPIFYKDVLDKVGVKMQVFRVGTFKSAVEPYILNEMSDANREMMTSFLTDIWGVVKKDVAASRKIAVDSLDAYADRYTLLASTDEYKKLGLVNNLAYADEVRDRLRDLSGSDNVRFVETTQLAVLDKSKDRKANSQVAVYYAEGEIIDAIGSSFNRGGSSIVGPQVVSDLDELASDDRVKAVVLRVNSPGGSAYASEQMWRAVQKLREKKPVVVSMGGYAASGGYYLSCGADYIISEPTTLTGSIGIFGLIPDATNLLTEKIGLHFDVVKTNAASDFGAMGRSFTAAESAAMQGYVERGYDLFLSRVAAGRKMSKEQVNEIAQGRVWTGQQALRIKLVDRLGTLDDAIAEAARRAGVKNYAIGSYPVASDWLTNLINQQKNDYFENRLRATLGEFYQPLRFAANLADQNSHNYLQARLPFDPNIK